MFTNVNIGHFGESGVWDKSNVRCKMVEIQTKSLVSGRIDVYNDFPNEIGAGWLRFIGPFSDLEDHCPKYKMPQEEIRTRWVGCF